MPAGYSYDKASLFTVEKTSGGTGNVSFGTESIFLKAGKHS